jgi:hypothetical protein
MSKIVRQLLHSTWALSALIGILAMCLLGIIASYPRTALWLSKAAQAEFADALSLESESTPLAKKPVRYEAVINNWKRHRSSATKPNEIAVSVATEVPTSGSR